MLRFPLQEPEDGGSARLFCVMKAEQRSSKDQISYKELRVSGILCTSVNEDERKHGGKVKKSRFAFCVCTHFIMVCAWCTSIHLHPGSGVNNCIISLKWWRIRPCFLYMYILRHNVFCECYWRMLNAPSSVIGDIHYLGEIKESALDRNLNSAQSWNTTLHLLDTLKKKFTPDKIENKALMHLWVHW